jgi:hypothetical protein
METGERVFIEGEDIIFEKRIEWEYIRKLAEEQGIEHNSLSLPDFTKKLQNAIQNIDDIEELFEQYLADSSNEK